MANVVKKDWTFVDYLTFINAVVNKSIENGLEYKNFYTALFAANMFFDYEPDSDEDGNFNLNEVWSDLRKFNGIKDENGEVVFANVDFYMLANNPRNGDNDKIINSCFPIDVKLYDEMLNHIDDKLFEYKNRDTVKESATNLLNRITEYVDALDKKYEGVDITETARMVEKYAEAIKESDFKQTAKELAKVIHQETKDNKADNTNNTINVKDKLVVENPDYEKKKE